jgi:hypothetical protein
MAIEKIRKAGRAPKEEATKEAETGKVSKKRTRRQRTLF